MSPSLDLWSDASDVGWGAHLGPHVASGLWDLGQASLSINARELLAIQHGLLHFQLSLPGHHTVAVSCDNVTAVVYLRKEGGTRSPLLNAIAQEILRWSESLAICLAPQFILGSNNVLADALSRPHQLPHSEWCLNMTVFRSLCRLWPVQIDCLRPPPITVARFIFHRTETLSRRARTPSPSPGTVYRLTPFLRLPSFSGSLRNSGNLGGRSSPLWLRIGLRALGFRISSSCRWPLRSSFQIVPTSCSCLDLDSATRVSTGYGFMPGDSPAVHQGCGILLCSSGAVFLGAPFTSSAGLFTGLGAIQSLALPWRKWLIFSVG